MKHFIASIILFCLTSAIVLAKDIFLTATRDSAFNPALDVLTVAIADHGYTLIKIQPVDEGLRHMGYKYSAYKVLFFGDRRQVDKVLAARPEAAVMLPLKIILYQKGDIVVASAPSMEKWKGVFGNTLNPLIDKWERDITAILREFTKK